ncbi:glycosyltransferase family 2 protein [Paludibacter jiangxiensis]|uniref:Glycosyltransferase n=1 Tax=Paludibacter jiangxiensis TaxID=681398 RepID=A0A161L7S6_9BACT|nr:glycosyltransferase family 2 protein [Paludibacter jiangxiensis]GAT62874.1 glycosyltransferase [Paludibacter jiangxiensis]
MIKLSIITINYNNAEGLQKTMKSVFAQTAEEFEYIVIDGASTDESKEVIIQYAHQFDSPTLRLKWLCEPDNGIYHAMNKGIKMAQGEYVQFLNSGDLLATQDVTKKMLRDLESKEQKTKNKDKIAILYGNMLKSLPKGILCDRGLAGKQPAMIDFIRGTINHSPSYIRRSLYDKYGLYDEKLKIVSDWKWFLQVVVFGEETTAYADIDVTIFDMHGISSTNHALDKAEREQVLSELLPAAVMADYKQWAFPIEQMKRLNRYWLTRKLVWWMERGLFKWEKWTKRK